MLASTVTIGWLLGEFRNYDIIQWHFYAGYCTGALLLFRVYWGLAGPESVRFASLIPHPRAVIGYLKELSHRQPSGVAGHSPVGSIAVLTMLILLTIQVTSGLFAEDDDLFHEGPLADFVSSQFIGFATSIHHTNSSLLLILFGLHLGVMVFYYFWKKENLVVAMLSGKKTVRVDNATSESVEQI